LIVAKIATDTLVGAGAVHQSFALVFTSAYLVSSLYQVFFWKVKSDHPFPYAAAAILSNLLTTGVGWMLALGCTQLKWLGGHVLYDLSIPLSYFLIYIACVKKDKDTPPPSIRTLANS
jgi:hypothetical protein